MENIQNYENFKRDTDIAAEKIRTGAMTMAQGMVEMGYQLKIARDTGILRESGYTTMAEFAKAEYGFRPDQTSRYIKINDQYSENGYSRNLKGKYIGFGESLLTDMLQLPDTVRDEITQNFSREDIRNLVKEVKEENKVTDLEIMMEEKDSAQAELTLLEQSAYQIGKDFPELYIELFSAVYEGNMEELAEILVPDEEKIYSIRIQGTGRVLLSLKLSEKEMNLINVRSQEKESYTWQQLAEAFKKSMHFEQGPIESWEKQYGDTFPDKNEEPQKTQKVQKAKKPESKKEEKAPEVTEDQIPGQDNIENHPEYMPAQKKQEEPEIAPAQFEPSPDSITSKCYSCTHYSECNVKSGTVKECNEYINKAEAEKTEEQKYNEEQNRIYRETKKKLREIAQEEKMEHLPSETGQKVHQIRLAGNYFNDVEAGIKSFDLRKNDHHYKTGDILEFLEFAEGRNTGRLIRAEVTYILEDYTGLEDGYCIMAIKVLEVTG